MKYLIAALLLAVTVSGVVGGQEAKEGFQHTVNARAQLLREM